MSTAKSKVESKRRSPGGIGITKRGDKYEATYSIPKEQLPPGAPRKRITAWGESERAATTALMEKLRVSNIAPNLPEKLSNEQLKEIQNILGPDGVLIKEKRSALYADDSGPKLKDWAKEWEEEWIGEQVQESTRIIYHGHLQTWILPYLGEYHLNELSTLVLKTKWWNPITRLRKVDRNGVTSDTPLLGNSARANIYKTLLMVLSTAHSKLGTRIGLDPMLIAIPKAKRPETDQEVVLATNRLRKIFFEEPDKDDLNWSIFALSLLGLRQAERLGIAVSDIDLSDKANPVIYLRKQLSHLTSQGGWYLKDATKNGESRIIPLRGIYLEAVEKQLERRATWSKQKDWKPDPKFADLLFLQPGGLLWTRRKDTDAWHKFVGEGIRGHLARHVTGHLLAEAGVGVESAGLLLGHKSDAWASYYRVVKESQLGTDVDKIDQHSRRNAPASIKRKKSGV